MQITEAELCELGVGLLSSIYVLKVRHIILMITGQMFNIECSLASSLLLYQLFFGTTVKKTNSNGIKEKRQIKTIQNFFRNNYYAI